MVAPPEIPTDAELRAHRAALACERARRGAELLDQARPGWAGEIDPRTLDIRVADECVLGQLFASYDDGVAELAPPTVPDESLGDWASDHGFTVHPDVTDPVLFEQGYADLTDAWRAEIARRATHAEPPAPERQVEPAPESYTALRPLPADRLLARVECELRAERAAAVRMPSLPMPDPRGVSSPTPALAARIERPPVAIDGRPRSFALGVYVATVVFVAAILADAVLR